MELPDILTEVVDNCDYSSICLGAVHKAYNVLKALPEDATYDEKISARNQILANDGVLAEMFGTINTEPTLTAAIMGMRGLKPAEASMVESSRDIIRNAALNLVRGE